MAICPDDHVVDPGCGPGVDTIALTKYVEKSERVTGIDNDAEMIQMGGGRRILYKG